MPCSALSVTLMTDISRPINRPTIIAANNASHKLPLVSAT